MVLLRVSGELAPYRSSLSCLENAYCPLNPWRRRTLKDVQRHGKTCTCVGYRPRWLICVAVEPRDIMTRSERHLFIQCVPRIVSTGLFKIWPSRNDSFSHGSDHDGGQDRCCIGGCNSHMHPQKRLRDCLPRCPRWALNSGTCKRYVRRRILCVAGDGEVSCDTSSGCRCEGHRQCNRLSRSYSLRGFHPARTEAGSGD